MVDAPDIAKQKQYINLSLFLVPSSPISTVRPQKFLCNDCIFDNHYGHKIARLKLVDEILLH